MPEIDVSAALDTDYYAVFADIPEADRRCSGNAPAASPSRRWTR